MCSSFFGGGLTHAFLGGTEIVMYHVQVLGLLCPSCCNTVMFRAMDMRITCIFLFRHSGLKPETWAVYAFMATQSSLKGSI